MMGDILPGFVTHMESRPATLLVVAAPETVEEAKAVIKSEHIFHYDTTFDLAIFMFPPLFFVMLHFKRHLSFPLHSLFTPPGTWKTTNRSFAPSFHSFPNYQQQSSAQTVRRLEGAIQSVLPQARIVNCWNHISNNVKHKMGSEGAEAVADYQQAIKELLTTKSRSDYKCTLESVRLHWSPDFMAYFHQSLSDAMDKSAQYVLNSLGIQSWMELPTTPQRASMLSSRHWLDGRRSE